MFNLNFLIMKKRFLVNNDAVSLWEAFEESESIKIVGGISSSSHLTTIDEEHVDGDNQITIWKKSF